MAYLDFRDGIDGSVPFGVIASDGCCPPDLCSISPESLACSAINLLPSGPLWDVSKQAGLACKGNCDDLCVEDNACGTLVSHAIYTARKLYYNIFAFLWPALRESSPATAFTTMEEWLDRLGWVDCYNQFCRDPALGAQSPYEVLGECGIEYCPPTFSPELALVYKRGIILALWRLRHGLVPNMAGINFVLSSLYAELVIDPDYNPEDPNSPKCLILQSTADFAPVVIKEPCPETETTILQRQGQVKLFITPDDGLCAGGPPKAYPLVLAAHCIVRSLLPTCCNICVIRKP